jgi:hypothetical protein
MASEHTSDYVLNPAQIKALKRAVFSKKYGYSSDEDEITLTLCDLDESKIVISEEVIVKACLAYLRNYPCKSAKQELAMHQGMEYFEEVLLDYENEDEEEYYEEEDPYTYDYSPVFPWTFEGTNYMRDKNGHVWRVHADGGCGQWCGVYDASMNRIDDTVYNAIYATMGK